MGAKTSFKLGRCKKLAQLASQVPPPSITSLNHEEFVMLKESNTWEECFWDLTIVLDTSTSS